MTEKVKWNTKSDIILKYKTLEKNQGLKIYYKTADYDNTGDEIIVSQIIPSECTLFYSKDIPIQAHGVMKNFNTGIQTIGWDIYNKRFEINVDAITDIEIIDYAVDEIIKEFNLGRAGTYQRLRTHMFRKFNASILKKAGMSESDIDEIQGRGKSSTRAAYFYEDPETLRKKYIDCLPALAINDNVNVLDFKAPEYRRLEEEVKEKNDLVNNMEERLSNVEEIFNQVNNLSDDEILNLFTKKKQGD